MMNRSLPSRRVARRMRGIAAACALASVPLTLGLAPGAALAQAAPVAPPSGVLSLSAERSIDVQEDVVRITLFSEQESQDAATLTRALNKRADEALRQARSDDKVTVQTGAFTIYPSTNRDGKIAAWRGRTEIVLESRDFGAASRLAGQLSNTMQVDNVVFSLSPQARRDAETKLTSSAITAFRDQAQAAAQAFGYGGYTIREVRINQGAGGSPRPFMMMATPARADAKAAAPLPIEAGKSTVTVDVSGSIQMTR
ncbi:putative secreted protein [Mycetohabitans endofungorum]|uniref:Putative secreted protein n=2 Tax=Burkholderiaceae TaxID=119060 RepID=A0A2P5KE53_9BURK|nr:MULTISPECIES: SIMPL domain-containing protein [Mycetohabitans]PPB84993.1 putative secreted protein [Mycetohabitans endofungorum]